MNTKDSDFLLWMAKRLVYKYRENPDLILVVNKIIDGCSVKTDIYEDFFNSISVSITNIVDNINQNKHDINNSFAKIQQKIKQEQNSVSQISTFDNLDVESLFSK